MMSKFLSGDMVAKIIILFGFFICYSWAYHAMVKDEKSLGLRVAQRLERMEKISQGFSAESSDPNQTF